TMASVKVAALDFKPIIVYFVAVGVVFAATMLVYGFNTLAATRALGHTFSNNVMIGIPLIGLVFGNEGLVVLLTLISVHALVLLGSGTLILELAQAKQRNGAGRPQGLLRTVGQAAKNSVIHPVPLPIIAGLLFAQTGLVLPQVIDKPLQLLGSALGPMALLLVGVTLAYSRIGSLIKPALRIASVKILIHPLVFIAVAWGMDLSGVPMAAMALAATLPTGANVLMFAQRYEVGEQEITASIALGTMCCLLTVPGFLLLINALQ
ncbi:MAG: AEC family transporter, partial [Comamonas sp.]